MKAVILAGGFGTRISEETHLKPKPMVEVGSKPILWHIMKHFSAYSINDFIICCGYKGYVIKEYFANYFLHNSDATFNLRDNSMEIHRRHSEDWRVTVVDTGEHTQTGGRLKRVATYLDDEPFYFTYGDGLSNVDLHALREFHVQQGLEATVTGVQPPGRFGALRVQGERVTSFEEKPKGDGAWVSGGYFVLQPSVLTYVNSDDTIWEESPIRQLVARKQMGVYRHSGFWQSMDTLRDRNLLERLWTTGQAPWLSPPPA